MTKTCPVEWSVNSRVWGRNIRSASVEALWGNLGKPAIPSWRKPEVSAKQTSAESAPTENYGTG